VNGSGGLSAAGDGLPAGRHSGWLRQKGKIREIGRRDDGISGAGIGIDPIRRWPGRLFSGPSP